MTILTAPARRVKANQFDVVPATDESFLAELDPSWSILPRADGSGLTPEELAKLTRQRDRARAAYVADTPGANALEVRWVAEAAAQDALHVILKARPAVSNEAEGLHHISVASEQLAMESDTQGLHHIQARPAAPCCDSLEEVPCLGCSSLQVDSIPGAEPEMTSEELEDLAELNRTNPAGTVEADLDHWPAYDRWPQFTSNFYWSDAPTSAGDETLDLPALIELTARRFRSLDNGFGDLVAEALDELARTVRTVDASVPAEVSARLEVLASGYTAAALSGDWLMPGEPERTPAGQWA